MATDNRKASPKKTVTPTPKNPRNVRWELACLEKFPPIVEGSIAYKVLTSGAAHMEFKIKTDLLMRKDSDLISDVEKISFVFESEDNIGKSAPTVYALRPDFPRHLSHLNPGLITSRPSLCLARSGLQSIYDTSGINGCLERLLDWLNDAKTGSFYEHGWEPVPGIKVEKCVLGYINPVALQEHASRNPDSNYAFGIAALEFTGQGTDNLFIQAATPLIDRSISEQNIIATNMMASNNADGIPFHTAVPHIFVWPPRTQVEEDTHFGRWQNMSDLIAGLRATGLYDLVDDAFLRLGQAALYGANSDADKRGNRAKLLTIGLWRPAPIDSTIVGLSLDSDARHLELRTFYLERPLHDDALSLDTNVRHFYGQVTTIPETLAAVSGETALVNSAILGVGALGSSFVDYAVRGGTDALTVIDEDIILSHNIARHRALKTSVRHAKVKVAKALAENRAQDVNVSPFKENFATLSDADIAERFKDCCQVIDTTANPLVRRRLAKLSEPKLPILRSEIYHKGMLGVSMLTIIGNPQNLNMLFYQLLAMAMDKKTIGNWLTYEASRTFKDEELLLGFGCASLTTKMPMYKVDAHASTAFALAKNKLPNIETPIIALNSVDEDGLSKGVQILTPPSVTVFGPSSKTNNWRIIVANNVLEKLHELRIECAPNETGGYFYGSMDEDAEEIYIVAASPEPPSSETSPSVIELGPWGQTGYEKTFLRRTRNRLPPIGTWHSHPSGSPAASAKDKRTIDKFKEEDISRGLPTLMGITGRDSDEFYVLGD